jgi:hypothetical protein
LVPLLSDVYHEPCCKIWSTALVSVDSMHEFWALLLAYACRRASLRIEGPLRIKLLLNLDAAQPAKNEGPAVRLN